MAIGAVCTRNVVAVMRGATIREAAMLMRERHVGDVVVVSAADKRVPIGILTDRDIAIEVVGLGLSPEAPVESVMGAPLLTLREEDGLEEALEWMERRGVRRAPVIDRDGHLAGIVSSDDLVRLLARELTRVADLMQRGRVVEILRNGDPSLQELST
jgi:CBS domain-containing protein